MKAGPRQYPWNRGRAPARAALWGLLPLLVLLTAGCARHGASSDGPNGAVGDGTNAVHYPLVKPVLKLPGRVVTVNAKLRFAVLDFGLNPLPPDQSLLDVIRDGKTVGEMRVNGPAGGSFIVADLVRGEVAPGDEVRPK